MSTLETLNEVFRVVFDEDAIQIRPETTADDIDGWDSLSHINLIVAVEARFGIRFQHGEILTFKDVGDLVRSIEKKIA